MAEKINLVPPAGVRSAAKRGIKLVAEGKAGGGFEPATLARARKIAAGTELTPDHVKRMYSFFRRHSVDRRPNWGAPGKETPGYVAWQAWGGDAGASWSAVKVAQMKRLNMSEHTTEDRELSEDAKKSIEGMMPQDPSEWKYMVDMETLKKVYWRGWSDYPMQSEIDLSQSQWALSRVAAFLHILEYGEPDNPDYDSDNDLLPGNHPLSGEDMQMSESIADAQKRREAIIDGRVDSVVELILAETGKPGINYKQVTPQNKSRLRGLMQYYAKKPHPFRACVRDNRKRFGPRTEGVCAVLKDLIMNTTKWRRGNQNMSEDGMFSVPAATEDGLALVDEAPLIDDELAAILLDLDDSKMAEIESLLWDEAV